MRGVGYLLDCIPAIVVGLVGVVPIIGAVIAGLVLAPYWLLRDVTGGSLGKRLLKFRVVGKDGLPAATSARILRNLPLAIGPGLLIIPVLGIVLGVPIAGVMVLGEVICLSARGERLGDMLAGTMVVRR